MDIKEELKSAGAYPSGPCSAWPQERHQKLMAIAQEAAYKQRLEAAEGPLVRKSVSREEIKADSKKMPGLGKMASGLARTTGSALRFGKVSKEVREERYDTCKKCPAFIQESERCSECGCFMKAKTWVGGKPETLCPLNKWSR